MIWVGFVPHSLARKSTFFPCDVGRGKDNRHAREDEERNERPHKWYTLDKNTVCYGCGVKVHTHPECPEKVASIRRSGQSRCKVVQGRVGTDHANDTRVLHIRQW